MPDIVLQFPHNHIYFFSTTLGSQNYCYLHFIGEEFDPLRSLSQVPKDIHLVQSRPIFEG